ESTAGSCCCSIVARGGRQVLLGYLDLNQRDGNIAGLFQVMAHAVRFLDKKDADSPFISKFAKIATAEIVPSKVISWSNLLVNDLVSGITMVD
ncbi:hypothetical protein RJ641_025196, partial [Dillenia turbinata]